MNTPGFVWALGRSHASEAHTRAPPVAIPRSTQSAACTHSNVTTSNTIVRTCERQCVCSFKHIDKRSVAHPVSGARLVEIRAHLQWRSGRACKGTKAVFPPTAAGNRRWVCYCTAELRASPPPRGASGDPGHTAGARVAPFRRPAELFPFCRLSILLRVHAPRVELQRRWSKTLAKSSAPRLARR